MQVSTNTANEGFPVYGEEAKYLVLNETQATRGQPVGAVQLAVLVAQLEARPKYSSL